jgi:hypothetical protein
VTTLPVGVTIGSGTPHSRLRIVTPLGIRFRDVALESPITHGLVVAIKPKDELSKAMAAASNPSGVFGFHGLPGLRAFEYPDGRAEVSEDENPDFASPPLQGPFVVMVADRLARFLPAVFGVDVPLAGLPSPPVFDVDPDPAPVLDAYLFSAPTRPVTAGLAAVRADLWDLDEKRPAAYARVRVKVGDRTGVGVADEEGRVLVLLPYPLLERLRLGSPPGTGQPPPAQQLWPAEFEVFYGPALSPVFESDLALPAPWSRLPGLKTILAVQDRAFIWATAVGPPVLTWTGQLMYDRELVIRTVSAERSQLWVSRGPSPPS